jgi:hypothetical protein
LLSEPRLRRRMLVFLSVLALSFVPMAGTLGYFSSLLLAAPLSLLAAAAGVDGVQEIRLYKTSPRSRSGEAKTSPRSRSVEEGTAGSDDQPGEAETGPLWLLVGDGARELAWLLGLALAPLLLGMLWNLNCDPLGGAAYFAIGPLCSAILGWVAGVTMVVLVGERPRWQLLLAASAPFLASTLVGVHRLYFQPVVFAYDPFWGWFSGPIYDEGVAISRRFLLFRAYNFTVVIAVWLLIQAGADAALRLSFRRMLADGPRRCCSSFASASA